MNRETLEHAASLMSLEVGEFLIYVTEVASPTLARNEDQELVAALAEARQQERELEDRLSDLIRTLGGRAQRRSCPFDLGYYNFARVDLLLAVLGEKAASDLVALEVLAAEYQHASSLGERLLSQLLGDLVARRQALIKNTEKLLSARAAALAAAAGAALTDAPASEDDEAAAPAAEGEEFPWHDEDLSLDERMGLVKGGTKFDQLFAAMAQTDCTACGYDCEGYARAIAAGEEKDLSKCAPGEDETQEMLESLVK